LGNSKKIRLIDIPNNISYNYCYVPIFFSEGKQKRDVAYKIMREKNIICRKYWSPLITDHIPYSKMNYFKLVNAKILSDNVLCLPIYPDLKQAELNKIFDTLITFIN
jgi:Predicted pyridoxal phosphate-dependent enzyme apparently involved in regulation of cell wall biogenesis